MPENEKDQMKISDKRGHVYVYRKWASITMAQQLCVPTCKSVQKVSPCPQRTTGQQSNTCPAVHVSSPLVPSLFSPYFDNFSLLSLHITLKTRVRTLSKLRLE